MEIKSTPNLEEFKPLPQQMEIITYIRQDIDYSKGTHEVLLSGSVGSSKSITLAHLILTHGLMYPKARIGIGRLALPQLKATLCQKIREHLYETQIDYQYKEVSGDFKLPNASEIKAISWSDGNLAKLGSMEFSAFAIEELTETDDSRPYDVILQRTNRLPHIKEPWVVSATNPDGPSHWAYKKLIMSKSEKVKVFYSNTFDNPYLPRSYIETLKERLDERMAQRMIYGKWIEIQNEVVYYAYLSKNNYRDKKYQINPMLPLRLCFDFNIGNGKPLSMVMAQYDSFRDEWHFFNEIIIDGQRTLDCMDELASRGFLDMDMQIKVHGDATGRARDTRSIQSDYDIIDNFLANYKTKSGRKLMYSIDVPRANPPIRERHNVVNAYCMNANGKHRLFVYKDAPTVDEGLRLTRLKTGAQYVEYDEDRFQHCTTSIGYAIMWEYNSRAIQRQSFYNVGTF